MLKTLMLSAALLGVAAAPSLAQTAPTTPVPPASPSMSSPSTTNPSPSVAAVPRLVTGSAIIGTDIKNPADETIGEIDDVVVDADGKIVSVIVSVGGFLGMGTRHVAVPWSDLRFDRARDVALLNMTKDQLKSAPEYKAQRVRVETPRTVPAPGTTVPAPAPRN